ncbi:MAG: hypothetical protein ACP5MD_05690 [Verrucomicrobiia bacterium]
MTDSELVFVGYGVIAPEYGWDDFKGVDLRGKTMVVLVGDPPVPDPSDASNRDEFTANDYHKPNDVIKPDWDLSGAVEDLELLAEVGRAVANAEDWPQWKEGSEFRARRAKVPNTTH